MQCYRTQSILKTGLSRPLMRENLDKLDKCELLTDSSTDENEKNSYQNEAPRNQRGSGIPVQDLKRNNAIDDRDWQDHRDGGTVTLRKLEWESWILNLQRKLATQLTKASWSCCRHGARRWQIAGHIDIDDWCSDGATHPHGRIKIRQL